VRSLPFRIKESPRCGSLGAITASYQQWLLFATNPADLAGKSGNTTSLSRSLRLEYSGHACGRGVIRIPFVHWSQWRVFPGTGEFSRCWEGCSGGDEAPAPSPSGCELSYCAAKWALASSVERKTCDRWSACGSGWRDAARVFWSGGGEGFDIAFPFCHPKELRHMFDISVMAPAPGMVHRARLGVLQFHQLRNLRSYCSHGIQHQAVSNSNSTVRRL